MELFWLVALACGAILFRVLKDPAKIYEFPYFTTAAFSGFILPQAYGLYVSQAGSDEWQRDLYLTSLVFLGASVVGYSLKPNARLVDRLRFSIDPQRFVHAGVVLMAMGFFFDWMIERLPAEAKGSQWTGVITIYGFFAGQIYTGFAICLYCAVGYRKAVYWVLAGIGSMIPLVSIVFYGRREPAALVILTVLLIFFFERGFRPPRAAVVAMLLAATVLIPFTERYRQGLATGDVSGALDDLRPGEVLSSYADHSKISEVRNAMYIIAATRQVGIYGYGSRYWNGLVFAFVPAQILGADFKRWLMIGLNETDTAEMLTASAGYEIPLGSTSTCLADSFQQFGFFGPLFYALVGYLFRQLWTGAVEGDNPALRIFYIQAMVASMRSVTHSSGEFLPGAIYSGMFLSVVIWYARRREQAWASEALV